MPFSGCLVSGNYNMTADLLELEVTQDEASGAINRAWTYKKTIPCYATSIATDAVSDASSGKKFNAIYREFEVIKILTVEDVSKRYRITNIRGADGELLWYEVGSFDGRATMFEVQGNYRRFDPFGDFIENEILAKRVEVQPVG